MTALEHRMSDVDAPGLTDAEMDRYGELQMEFQRGNGYELENRAQPILTGLGIGKDRFHLPVESFAGGWKMRIALARILLLDPDVLLMDEPTNHLDLESIVWKEASRIMARWRGLVSQRFPFCQPTPRDLQYLPGRVIDIFMTTRYAFMHENDN